MTQSRQERAARAISLKKQRDLPAAARLLEGLMAEDRDDLYAAGHLAHVLLLQGRVREAIALADQVLSREPDNGFVRFVRAEALARDRRHAEAATEYEAALAAGFRSAYLWARLAGALTRCRDREGARRALERGLGEFPGDGKLLLQLARLEEESGQAEAAARHREAAAEALPGDAYAYADVVAARARSRGRAEGAEEIRRLLKIPTQARNPHLHDQLSRLLTEAKDFAGALEAARRAHELEPANRLFHARLAHALARAGRDGEALREFEACLDGDPENPALNKAYVAAARRAGRLDEAHAFYLALLRRRPEAHKVFGWMRRVARAASDDLPAD